MERGVPALIADLLTDGDAAGVELPRPSTELLAIVETHTAALDEVTTPRLIHWDLWDLNVFVDPTSLAVVGVIDFERVLWADPLMEAQFFFHRGDDALSDAYGAALFAAPGAVARRQLYDLYLALVMTIECAYRHYPTDDIDQMGRGALAMVLAELDPTA